MSRIHRIRRSYSQSGMTLLELIIACSILAILATMALPVARWTAYRERERELKRDLRQMREAIDRYKDLADRGLIRVDALRAAGILLAAVTGAWLAMRRPSGLSVRRETQAAEWPKRASATAVLSSAPPTCTSRLRACSRRRKFGGLRRIIASPKVTTSWDIVDLKG